MTITVFDKTDKGREEIATRVHHLAPRQRTLLLLVDGHRDTVDLMAKVSGLGLDEKALVDLLEGGFIQVHENAAAVIEQAPGGASSPTADASDAPPAAETIAGASIPRGARPDTPSGAAVNTSNGILRDGETQFQALYNFYTETIRSAVGLRGYGMQLKVERAAAIADLKALREPYLEAVMKSKGPELERSLRNRLDQLLSLGD